MVPEIAARHCEQPPATRETCIATIAAGPRFGHIFFGIHSGKTEDFVNAHGKGQRQRGRGGGGGVAVRWCAAQQGMVFASLKSGTGSTNQHFSLEQGNDLCPFRLWNTVGVRATFFLSESRCKRTLFLFPLGSRCIPKYAISNSKVIRLTFWNRVSIFNILSWTG